MTSIYLAKGPLSFDEIKEKLLSFPTPLIETSSPNDAALTDAISTLYLHPAFEALLHILNQDLASAHFLVRHMQCEPEIEGMWIHGILHRIEGDVQNARAWYADVCETDVFEKVWGKSSEEEKNEADAEKDGVRTGKLPNQRKAREFLDCVEAVRDGDLNAKQELEKDARREVETLLEWCGQKFGTEKNLDASKAWVQPGGNSDVGQKKQSMLTGGDGFRKF
ncbi:uncharacterized protein MYCFIDRAFT_135275 [Pseudocercospora fijiensis CIRAD86]|uniref:Uncharacterized protein n=1 Tax=Pseudocercospora fijiensis (strain CIRAD86) TaxID=383855 RepID=M3B4T2_PSEFD|nr:uncharacterized protein MYCFIDRAFT_135275 [Pseudocercospora fijiensis CIRAD86]EME84362.1 hypothetical protein MYCFIDRAFT_135275 [Pseudocercospora fijiensis CIRAD86]